MFVLKNWRSHSASPLQWSLQALADDTNTNPWHKPADPVHSWAATSPNCWESGGDS